MLSNKKLRVLGVIPGIEEETSMCFARREMVSVRAHNVDSRIFFLRSRTSPRLILQEIFRLRKEIQGFKPDVVHAQFGTVTSLVSVLVSPVPVVITFQGQDLNPSPADTWLRSVLGRPISHFSARWASQIICVSPKLRDRIGYIRNRVHVIPSGVNTRLFHPRPRETCRAKIGWKLDEKIVVFNAGSDPVRKRSDLARSALTHIQKKIADVRLHIFDGKTLPDEIPWYLCAADCLVVASDQEGSPNIVKEAMACNLPVVSVDVGDVAERLAGVTPSAIVARTAHALGDALVEVLQSNRRSDGYKKMCELSENEISKRIVDVYRLAAGLPSQMNGKCAA